MKEIEAEELKTIQIDILQAVHDYCAKNNLKYSLCGGALIGAIRHKGFIPWDDDIDILMPRNDYMFLCMHFNEQGGDYLIHSLYNDPLHDRPFAKIENRNTILKEHANTNTDIGVAIDVFPYDNLGDTLEEAFRIEKKVAFWRLLYKGKLVKVTNRNSFTKKMAIYATKIVASFFSRKWLAAKIDKMSRENEIKTEIMGDLVWGYGKKEILRSNVFDKVCLVPFEDREFYAFENYDIYLMNVYGDYMQLPPENKRQSPHTLERVYWK